MNYIFFGAVAEVHDGDTVRVALDLGFSIFHVVSLRIKDLYCPELTGPERERGEAARDYARSLLPVNTSVTVRTFKTSGGQDVKTFDRYVAEVTLPTGLDFATCMINAGHGTRTPAALDRPGPA